MLLEPLDDGALGFGDGHAIQETRVDHRPVATIGSVGHVTTISSIYHLDDRQPEGTREFVVAGVVAGHGHDGAGAVSAQRVVCYPDGQALSAYGIAGIGAGEDTRLLPRRVAAC